MEFAFYFSAGIAVVATLRVISHSHPVHALLYLVVSLMAVAMCFFSLGAPFAGALEIIVYAGAIMVLFVFVMMILNLGRATAEREKRWLRPKIWIGPSILSALLLLELLIVLFGHDVSGAIQGEMISPKQVGMTLFGPYLLVVELASTLLLAALVTAWHLGRSDKER